MKAHVPSYDMVAPATVAEALTLIQDQSKKWKALAGGTDLMVQYEMGRLPEGHYMSLHRLKEMKGIRASGKLLMIGALTTFGEIKKNAIITTEFPMIAQAAAATGAIAIQNRGTIGGNIGNASPAADTPPALLCYDAKIELVSPRGKRLLDYADFHLGYKKMDMAPDELIYAIHLERPCPPAHDHYHKVGTREAQSISKVCFASRIFLSKKKIEDVRLAYGSVAATPLRALKTEGVLRGKTLSLPTISHALETLALDITPMDDIRSTGEYRLRVAQNILRHRLMGLKDGL